MKTIIFTGVDHWHDGQALVTGQTYSLPAEIADALCALGKAELSES